VNSILEKLSHPGNQPRRVQRSKRLDRRPNARSWSPIIQANGGAAGEDHPGLSATYEKVAAAAHETFYPGAAAAPQRGQVIPDLAMHARNKSRWEICHAEM